MAFILEGSQDEVKEMSRQVAIMIICHNIDIVVPEQMVHLLIASTTVELCMWNTT